VIEYLNFARYQKKHGKTIWESCIHGVARPLDHQKRTKENQDDVIPHIIEFSNVSPTQRKA